MSGWRLHDTVVVSFEQNKGVKVECASGEYTARIGGQIHESPLSDELIFLIR